MGKIVENLVPEEVLSHIHQANSLVIFTGAGISASALIPTLTGPGCSPVWEYNFVSDLLSLEKISGKSILHLRLLDDLLKKTRLALPTKAHLALSDLALKAKNFSIITQNFDDLHRRAGINNCIMLHGDITKVRCLNCNQSQTIEGSYKEQWKTKCSCGGSWRPDLLLFDEAMAKELWQEAEELVQKAEVFIAIGSSGQVLPGGLLPAIARRSGAFLVEVNLIVTEITPHFHFTILGHSDKIIPSII